MWLQRSFYAAGLLVVGTIPSLAMAPCPRLQDPPPAPQSAAPKVAAPPTLRVRHGGQTGTSELVFVGDSLTSGAGISSEIHRYPQVVSSMFGEGGRRFTTLDRGSLTSTQVKDLFLQLPASEGAVYIFWVGRNNSDKPAVIISDLHQMVDHIGPAKFLVLSVLPEISDQGYKPGAGGYELFRKTNTAISDAFPQNYVQVGADLECPDRSDNYHPNDSGYRKIAATVYQALVARGW